MGTKLNRRKGDMMKTVLLVGAGPMAVDYAKVLQALSYDPIVVGRGEASAKAMKEATGLSVHTGGLESWLSRSPEVPQQAIIAVGERWLGTVALQLLDRGVRRILVEKPGGHTSEEVKEVARRAALTGAEVYVGYNRRFYASVQKAQELIAEDGGVSSFSFEFTEWSHVIGPLRKEPGVKEQWFLHNSTHVIDLAFFLGGRPKELTCYTAGGLPWHPSASVFAGAGISERGALFSYQANWEAPGRWGVEVLTRKRRFIFRPLEKLQVQKIGSVGIEQVEIDDALDTGYKAGLYRQVNAFLSNDAGRLCPIRKQAAMVQVYDRISNYTS